MFKFLKYPAILCVLSFFSLLDVKAQEEKYVYYDQEKLYLKEKYQVSYANPKVLHGPFEAFYVTGKRQIKGSYTQGEPSGLWEYYFENGELKMRGHLDHGLPSGQWEYFYESGKRSMEGKLYGEVRNGKWTFYFENGDIKSEGVFNSGVRVGIWNYFYEDGSLKAQAFYEKGKGLYKEFYPSGQLKAEGVNDDGKSEGLWIFYYETGEKEASGSFSKGQRVGPWEYYHPNGNYSAAGSFNEGTKEGSWRYFHDDGSLRSEGNLVEGNRDGSWRLFERSGQGVGSIEYAGGIGLYSEYFESGKIKVKGSLQNETHIGQWYYYFESGKLEGECYFVDGAGQHKGYYEDGTLKMEGEVKNGVRVGEWKLYHPDGNLAGTYRPIYEDDRPVFRLTEEESTEPERLIYEKPEYKFKNRNSRFFTPRVGEYRGWILAVNPVSTLIGVLPVSIEYYHQERLGYEFQFIYLKKPFYRSGENVAMNKTYNQGSRIKLRQKFYDKGNRYGMFYFGQEVAFTSLEHSANVIDSTAAVHFTTDISVQEQRVEYGLFLGNRWMQNPGNAGFTVDMYIGAGIGYRLLKENYTATPERDAIFDDLSKSNISFPIIIGVNIGILGPKKGPGYFVN